jgi:glycosyltransferase involved in cell wall biosynthesis
MKVLYLSYDGLTDPLGQSQILPYLQGLANHGHDIHIIAFEKPDKFDLLGTQIKNICDQSKIHYYPQVYHKSPPLFSTLIDMRTMYKVAKQLNTQHNFNLSHCRSYISALIGMKLKKENKLPFIFDMRGFYADERVDGNLWPQSNPIYRLVYKYFKKKELQLLSQADSIVSLTSKARNVMLERNMLSEQAPVSIIPCCVDISLFNSSNNPESELAQLKSNLGYTESNLILGYVGSTGTWYLLKDMLRYFQKLHAANPEFRFLFLSFDNPEEIFREARDLNINTELIKIVGVNRNELPTYLGILDLSIFFIKPVFSKFASSPTKQAELMSMGIPVICNAGIGDTDSIIKQYEAGICLENTSDDELNKAVEETNALIKLNRERIIFGAKQYFSLHNGINTLNNIYQQIGR